MQSTSDFSTDPILRRIEQDMAPNSGASTPQREVPSPAPSSTISSLFSKAMSFGAVTPTGTPTNVPTSSVGNRAGYRQSSLFERSGSLLGRQFSNILSPRTISGSRGTTHTTHQLPRQRSLESSESLSPCGSSNIMTGASRYRARLVRRRSEGGEDAGSYLSDIGESNVGSYPEESSASTLRTTMLGGVQMPPIGIQGPHLQRFRPPFNRGGGLPPPRGAVRGMRSRPPFLSRGRSVDTPTSHISPYSPSLQTSASFQQQSPNLSSRIVPSQASTSVMSSYITSGITTSGVGGELSSRPLYSGIVHADYMSAPEGGGWGSGYESAGGLEGNTIAHSLYPRVHITSDSDAFRWKDQHTESLSPYEGGLVSSTSVPNTSSTTNFITNTAYSGLGRSSLLDPRSAVHSTASNAAINMPGPLSTNVTPSTTGGPTRRKLDSTFRTDSLSSDQSDTRVRPPPPKPHKPKRSNRHPPGHPHTHHQQHSHPNRAQTLDANNASIVGIGLTGSGPAEGGKALSGSGRSRASGSSGRGKAFGASSSDDEIRSTDCTSCGEEEMESESVSEKGKVIIAFYIIY